MNESREQSFQHELGQRLRALRERLQMTLVEVSDKIGFASHQILMNIESGERSVKAHELAKLARIYHVSVESLLLDNETVAVETKVWWRANSGSRVCREREQQFLQFCWRYYDLEKRTGQEPKIGRLTEPKSEPKSELTFASVEELARDISGVLRLGDRPAFILERLLEERLGVKILYLDLRECGSAASAVGAFGEAICLNRFDAPWRKRYNIAHELFHLFTHLYEEGGSEESRTADKPFPEQLADYFASCILLPQGSLTTECHKRVVDGKLSLLDCINLAMEFGVSTEALLWRLVSLRHVEAETVRAVLNAGELKKIDRERRAEQPGQPESTPYLSDRYVYLAFKSYQKGLISKGKLSECLEVPRGSLKRFLLERGYDLNLEQDYAKELAAA